MINTVFPVFAKRWHGFGDDDFTWQLFCIKGDEKAADETVNRMMGAQRRPRSRSNPFELGRAKEWRYEKWMVH